MKKEKQLEEVFKEVEDYLTGSITVAPTPDKLKKGERVVGELTQEERQLLGAAIILQHRICELKRFDSHIAFLKYQSLHAQCFLSALLRLQDEIGEKKWTVKTDFRVVVKEKFFVNFFHKFFQKKGV